MKDFNSRFYDLIIVGAGPAGLFAAYEAVEKGLENVLLLDEGNLPYQRNCPLNLRKVGECTHCSKCGILYGFGGGGLFSDGKLNFISKLGKTNLYDYLKKEEADNLINYVERIFSKFGMGKYGVYDTNIKGAETIKKKANDLGFDLLIIKQKHLGSDKLKDYISGMIDYLKTKGVDILPNTKFKNIYVKNNVLQGIILESNDLIHTKNALLAMGRVGSDQLRNLSIEYGIPMKNRGSEFGFRIELPYEIMKHITDVIYDPTFFIKDPETDVVVRTFCTNPRGKLTIENYIFENDENIICVNGYADKEENKKTNFTNFALLANVVLTEPKKNEDRLVKFYANSANHIVDGKLLLQRIIDLFNKKRTKQEYLKNIGTSLSLNSFIPGDISMAYPKKYLDALIYGIEKLDELIPGIISVYTNIIAPEIKLFGTEIQTNNDLETKIKGLYVAGDGAGKSGNIVGAAATGIIAVRGMVK